MTPPRTEPGVRPFPVFRVVVAADGTSATFNGHPIPTTGYPDLLTAVQATASAAAADIGGPVRMDLTTPAGQVRHLIAHPTPGPTPTPAPAATATADTEQESDQAPKTEPPGPVEDGPPVVDPETGGRVLGDTAALDETKPIGVGSGGDDADRTNSSNGSRTANEANGGNAANGSDRSVFLLGPPADPLPDVATDTSTAAPAPAPDPVVLPPRGDAVTLPPTTPPAAALNGHRQPHRLTPLDDPLPHLPSPGGPRAAAAAPAEPTPAADIAADAETGSAAVPTPAGPLARARDLRRVRGPRAVPDQQPGVVQLEGEQPGDPTPAPTTAPAAIAPAGADPAATPAAAVPAATPAAAVPAVLSPAGLLPRLRPTTARPTVGWQARVHSWTRGRWSPPPSVAEVRHRELVAAVQAGFTGPRLVAVVNPKGGAGKTPAVLATAATWGAHRGSVVAWDDNETRGTLAMRALADPRNPTVAGLLADLHRFDRPSARVGDLAAYLRPQGGARFDVLASDDDPARMAQFGAVEFARVRDVLARFYAVTVVDTGNNVRAGNWQAAVDAADSLLLVSTYQRDAAVTASWTLDHLHATGRGRLADTAVTVLSAATPTTDRRTRAELRDHFATRTRAVVEIPYDPVIADGEHLDLLALRPATREAWLEATAALTAGLTR